MYGDVGLFVHAVQLGKQSLDQRLTATSFIWVVLSQLGMKGVLTVPAALSKTIDHISSTEPEAIIDNIEMALHNLNIVLTPQKKRAILSELQAEPAKISAIFFRMTKDLRESSQEECSPMKGIVLLSLVCLAACSNTADLQPFIADAERYCEVHKESYWEESGKLEALEQLNGMERQIELAKEIRAAVKTPEMQSLIYEKGASVPAEEFYPYLQTAIPKLTGKPFDCPAIQEFYLPAYHEGY